MNYYLHPSPIALPIIRLFILNPHGECRFALYDLEKQGYGWNLLCCVKYLWRLGRKTPDLKPDLAKVIQYVGFELENPDSPLDMTTLLQIKADCVKLLKQQIK